MTARYIQFVVIARSPNGRHGNHKTIPSIVIASQWERWECRLWREKRPERVAAVDKIEDWRKPEDFIGHRNRTWRGNLKK